MPIIIQSKLKRIYLVLITLKLQIKKCLVFASYDRNTKIFSWLNPQHIKNLCSFPNYKKLSFCKFNRIKNLSEHEANMISLWYRVHYYISKHIDKDDWLKNSENSLRTTNLIKFVTDTKKKDDYNLVLYTLSDFGIPDPKLNILKSKINKMDKKFISLYL